MPGDIVAETGLTLRVGAALRAAAAVQGRGGPAERAAQGEVTAAARALLAHKLAAGAAPADLQPVVTTLCNALCMLAGLHATEGNDAAADHALDEAQAVADRHGDAMRRALVGLDVADAALALGEFARALAMLFGTRDALAREPDPLAQINPHFKTGVALAQAFNWLGDRGRAEAEIAATAAAVDRLGARAGASGDALLAFFRGQEAMQLRFQSMVVALDGGRFDVARAELDAIEPRYAALGAAPAAAMRLYRARVAAGLGDADAALRILEEIRPAFDREPLLAGKRGVIRTLRARVLLDAGRGTEALADASAGAELAAPRDQREIAWNAHWQHARALASARPSRDPLQAYDAAIAALDGLRRASLGHRLDNLYLAARRPMVDDAVRTAAARGDAARCLAYADSVKSRFLAAALAAGPPPAPDPARAARLDALSAEIDARRRTGGSGDPGLPALVEERAALLERMRIERGALEPPPFDLAAISDGLRHRGRAALQLYLAGRRLTAVLLHDGELHLDTLELGEATRAALDDYAANLRRPFPSRPGFDPASHGLDAASLVPPRLLERALGAAALLVSPHGPLNILPWAGLPRGGVRLFELLPVAVVPNIASVPLLAARPDAAPRAALFGDPADADLAAAERGVEFGPGLADLAALYGPKRLVAPPVTGAAATLGGYRALTVEGVGRQGVLHLVCHGGFDYDDPAGSGLKLSGRMLTAAEIALRPHGYAEVTMAACSTGVRPVAIGGVELHGDDVVGLPASFLEAGAGAVLVSTTVAGVPSGRAFFNAYHGRRLAGAGALDAYAGAQRDLLADGRHALRNWIGFTLYAA